MKARSEIFHSQIYAMASVLVGLGIRKVHHWRRSYYASEVDVRDLAKLQTIHREPLDIAVTTNGHMLAEMVAAESCRPHASQFPWMPLTPTVSPASLAWPTDSIKSWQESAPRAVRTLAGQSELS
jgi:hypothetical protein